MSQAEHEDRDEHEEAPARREQGDGWKHRDWSQDQDDGEDQDEHEGAAPARAMRQAGQLYREQRRPVRVEHHLWRHAFESSALAIVGTLLAAMILPHAWPLWAVTGFGAALTAVMWFTSLTATGSLVMANYLAAWGLLVTGWLSAAHEIGWKHSGMLAGLFIPGVVLAPLGAIAIGHHREQIRQDAEKHAKLQDTAPLRRWERTLARHGVPGVTVLDVIEHDGGLQIHGRLGKATDKARAITRAVLEDAAEPIAVSKRLDPDAIYFEKPKGGSAADFVMHVRNRSGPRPNVFLPRNNRPSTINRPFPVGVMDNGRKFSLTYREITVLIIGVKGSGKSNLENIFIAQLARCIDAVIFMIDLKGGRSARPWMMPWVEHHVPRPVIDWLATTREEAELMLDAILAGGMARSRSGEGWEKITPSADTPAVILVVDETGVMTGHGIRENGLSNYTLAQKLAQITETLRSEAIDQLIAALRGNVDIMGSTAVKAMSTVRIGLRVTSSADGDSIFPDDHNAAKALARLDNPGDGLVRTGPDISPAVHFYRIGGEEQIRDVALSTGALRPVPEARMITAMGEAYTDRWKRQHGQDLLREWRESAGLPEPAEHDEKDPFWAIVAQQEDPEKPQDPRRISIRRHLHARGDFGYTVGRLVTLLAQEGQTTPRETIQRWLADDEKTGMVQRTGPPFHRWVWHANQGPDDLPGTD